VWKLKYHSACHVARTAKRTNGFFFFRTLDIQRPANIEILLKPKWEK